jgi:hypothetical protein
MVHSLFDYKPQQDTARVSLTLNTRISYTEEVLDRLDAVESAPRNALGCMSAFHDTDYLTIAVHPPYLTKRSSKRVVGALTGMIVE